MIYFSNVNIFNLNNECNCNNLYVFFISEKLPSLSIKFRCFSKPETLLYHNTYVHLLKQQPKKQLPAKKGRGRTPKTVVQIEVVRRDKANNKAKATNITSVSGTDELFVCKWPLCTDAVPRVYFIPRRAFLLLYNLKIYWRKNKIVDSDIFCTNFLQALWSMVTHLQVCVPQGEI